jgi:hypothetical protein
VAGDVHRLDNVARKPTDAPPRDSVWQALEQGVPESPHSCDPSDRARDSLIRVGDHLDRLRADEVPLTGGISMRGVVRVGDTVRRPLTAGSQLVHGLLEHFERCGFDGARASGESIRTDARS